MSERDLYPPIKAFLEAQGYEVKGEIEHCDVVAVRDDDPPVIVELKESLSFALVLQGVDRLSVSDQVYIGFRVGKKYSSMWRSRRRQVTGLLRRLGLSLLTVSTRDNVVPVLDPLPYRPRGSVGRSGMSGVLMGNTAEQILDGVECSVLVTKPEGFESPISLATA